MATTSPALVVATPAPLCVSREVAAAMVDLSPNSFDAQVEAGRLPKPIQFGRRMVWSVAALAAAIDGLAGNGPMLRSAEDWLGALDGGDQGAGR